MPCHFTGKLNTCPNYKPSGQLIHQSVNQASDIILEYYGRLSQSLKDPVNIATLLHREKHITDDILAKISSDNISLSEAKAVLLKAIRNKVHSKHYFLQPFACVLQKFTVTASLGNAIMECYCKFLKIHEIYLLSFHSKNIH